MQVLGLVDRRHDLVVDLHTGLNEGGRCADVYCAAPAFLDSLDGVIQSDAASLRRGVRLFRIVEDRDVDKKTACERADEKGRPVCTTVIPAAIWKNRAFLYVGVEIYIRSSGAGTHEDWGYAAHLIGLLPVAYMRARAAPVVSGRS
ncbi:MAG: hypothetical protein K6360_06610 [Deltaproteobacteria bacterium]